MSEKWLIGVFDAERRILDAAAAARKAGWTVQDAYTPYPVHGMDEALGLPPSSLPYYCFAFGAAGLVLAFSFELWVSVFDWPMNIGGKSFNASPALFPVAFELTVLAAGLGTVFTFLGMRRLSPAKKPMFRGLGAMDDRFLLVIKDEEDGSRRQLIRRLLEEQGAIALRESGETE